MKLLITFVGLCLLMLGVLAWHLVARGGLRDVFYGPHAVRPPVHGATVNSSDGNEDAGHQAPALVPRPDAPTSPDEEPGTGGATPTSQPLVRWATDPARRDAWRRLQQARAVLHDEPDHAAALRDQAAALTELRRWSEAADTLARLVALDPNNVELLFEQATLLMQSRRWVEVIGVLKVLLELEPAHARAWFNLAVVHQTLGHLEEARQAWDRTIALSPSVEAAARRAEVLLDLHEWAAAAADFETVLEEQPDAADATLNLALAWWKLGRGAEARSRLLAFLSAHPRHVPVLNRLAETAWAECRAAGTDGHSPCEEAVQWCRQSLESDPDQPHVKALLDAASGS